MSWRQAITASRAGRRELRSGPLSPWWPTLTLLWVCIQGAFGALTVTMKLLPAIVTLHLLGGTGLLALLSIPAAALSLQQAGQKYARIPRTLRYALWLCLALLVIQVSLGGWVSTNYAVLACTSFPTCQGSWWPTMNFDQAVQIWRPLGLLQDGSSISFEALTAIHYTHRLMAYIVFIALAMLWWSMRKVPQINQQRRLLAFFALLQLLTGLSNVVLDWPLVAAVLHTGGAAALVTIMVWTLTVTSVKAETANPTETAQSPAGIAHKE